MFCTIQNLKRFNKPHYKYKPFFILLQHFKKILLQYGLMEVYHSLKATIIVLNKVAQEEANSKSKGFQTNRGNHES